MRKHSRSILASLVIISIFFLSASKLKAQANSIKVQPVHPPSGKLVDAGGHLLHLNIIGKGGPAVIMENGSGDFSFIWNLVQPQVGKFTTAVTYDRAGYAWSEPGPFPRTGHQLAFELHRALHNAGIKGPYILVGQSFGGFLVRNFARYYPKEVVGMVLVEALNEDSRIDIGDKIVRIREMAKGRQAPTVQTIQPKDKRKSTGKSDTVTLNTEIDPLMKRFPDSIQNMQIWAQSQPEFIKSATSEMDWSPEDVETLYLNKGKPAYMLGNKPLIVLTRGDGGYKGKPDSAELENERLKLQDDLAHLSTNSKHVIDKNSGHNIHVEDPSLVIKSIRQVYDAVIHQKKLR